MSTFELELLKLRSEGERYFPIFLTETDDIWRRFARYLCRRWRPPLGVDEQDVVHELMLAGWMAVRRWDPERGTTIDRFVRYNAIDKAKKWLHKQRDSYRRDGSAPSRAPTVFSAFERPDEEAGAAQDRLAWVGPELLEARLAARDFERELVQAFGEVSGSLPYRDRECLAAVALAGGSLEEAAEALYEDASARLALRFGSEEDAHLAVRRAVSKVIGIIGGNQQ